MYWNSQIHLDAAEINYCSMMTFCSDPLPHNISASLQKHHTLAHNHPKSNTGKHQHDYITDPYWLDPFVS